VPFATMTGKSQLKTMKLIGIIKDRNVTILVDFNSTHNCIDINFAKKLNFFVYVTKDFTIMIVDGKKVNVEMYSIRRSSTLCNVLAWWGTMKQWRKLIK
jgi:hypothetical protein